MCEEAAGSSFFTFKVFDVSSGAESGRKGQKKNDSKHRTRVCVCVCVRVDIQLLSELPGRVLVKAAVARQHHPIAANGAGLASWSLGNSSWVRGDWFPFAVDFFFVISTLTRLQLWVLRPWCHRGI